MKLRYGAVILILVVAIGAGFYQEYIKININYILDMGAQIPGFFDRDFDTRQALLESTKKPDVPFDYYHNHKTIDSLNHLSYKQLSILKWVAAVFFVMLFMLINIGVMRLLTKEKRYTAWMVYLYIGFFVLSFVIFLFGKLTGGFQLAYSVSREILGGLQSIVPLMILVPAIWLHKNKNFSPNS